MHTLPTSTVLPNDAYLLISCVLLLFIIYLLVGSTRIFPSLCFSHRVLVKIVVISCVLGWLCVLVDNLMNVPAILLLGFPCLGVSAGLLQVLWGVKYAALPTGAMVFYNLCAMLAAAIFGFISYPLSMDGQTVTMLFLPLFAITLYFVKPGAEREFDHAQTSLRNSASSTNQTLSKRYKNGFYGLLIGLLFARFLFALIYNMVLMIVSAQNSLIDATHFISSAAAVLILLIVVLIKRNNFDPAVVYRLVFPVTVTGFVLLYFLISWDAVLTCTVMSIGYKLFDLVFWILIMKLAHDHKAYAYAIILLATCANYCGMGLGRLSASLLSGISQTTDTLLVAVLGGCLLLVFVITMVLPEQRVVSAWGRSGTEKQYPAAALQDTVDISVSVLAHDHHMTGRETEVMSLLAHGKTQATIARHLSIAKGTVHTHVSHIYQKLEINSQEELIELIENSD